MDELSKHTGPTADERNLAMLAHLLGIFTGFIGALIVWLVKKNESAYIADQAREALNFQITMAIAFFIAGLLVMLLIGFLLIPMLWCVNILFCIIAALSASKGTYYRYPLAIRLVQ